MITWRFTQNALFLLVITICLNQLTWTQDLSAVLKIPLLDVGQQQQLHHYEARKVRDVKMNAGGPPIDVKNNERNDHNDHQTKAATGAITRTVSKNCKCGVSESEYGKLRIVGGVEAQPHSRPWMAAIVTKRNFQFCGGSIINNLFVLTAAHCVQGTAANRLFVVVGLHDKRNQYDLANGRYGVSKIIKHPNYDHVSVDNDIALLQLDEPIEFSESVLPACLPRAEENFAGFRGTVSGWGVVADSGPTSPTLREVSLPIMSYAECRRKFPGGAITTNMMCAGLPSGGQDACQGDSGGPMVLLVDGRWFVVGVVSWGNGCARADQPGVYTNATRYIAWIYSNTQEAVYCL